MGSIRGGKGAVTGVIIGAGTGLVYVIGVMLLTLVGT